MGDTGVEAAQEIEIEITDEIPSNAAECSSPTATGTESKDDGPRQERKDPEPCEKPDEEAFKQSQIKIKNELAEIQKKVDEMTAKIDAARVTRQKFRDEAKSAQDQLAATVDQRKSNTELIETTNQQYGEIAEARKQQRAVLDSIKVGLKFHSRAELDDAIVKIESRLATANLSPELRSKYMSDIALLKSQRMQTMRYEEQVALVRLALTDPDPLREERLAKITENRTLFAESDAAHKQKRAAQQEANKWNASVEDQISQRKEILLQKSDAQRRQNQLIRAYQNQERAFERYQKFLDFKKREAGRERRAAEKAERVAAAMARATERAERAAASGISVEEGEQTSENWSGDGVYKSKQAGEKPAAAAKPVVKRNNYDAQLNVINDLRRYLEFYKPKETGRPSETSASASVVQPRREFNEKKTVALLTKKKDIDDEWGSVIGTSKPAKAPRGEAPKPKKVKDTPMNHIPEALTKFKFVGVSPPLLTSQIDGVLKALEDQKRHFELLPDKEIEEAAKLAASKEPTSSPANDLEEGEIVESEDEGDADVTKDLSAQQIKAVAVTQEVLSSEAVEDLTTAFAAAAIQQANKVADAIVQVDEDAAAAAAGEEEMTPEQAAAFAALAGELGAVVEEAQAGLGDWVPPVAEKKPEHKDEQPRKTEEQPAPKNIPEQSSQIQEPKAQAAEGEEEEEEEMTPEQAAAMAALADELGEVVEEAQAGLGDWVPPVAEKKPEHKDEQHKAESPIEHKAEKVAEHKEAPASALVEGAEDEEELTPEQAAAMAALADELGEVVEEAQAGLGDWVPPVAEKKSDKPEAPSALAEIAQEMQDTVVDAVSKAVDAAVAGPTPATSTPATEEVEEAQDDEDEGEEGDEGEEEVAEQAEVPVTVKVAAPIVAAPVVQEIIEEVEYEEVEIEEGDEGEEGDEEIEVAQQ
jgi:hypothetical protein